jgi:hypothetical protein
MVSSVIHITWILPPATEINQGKFKEPSQKEVVRVISTQTLFLFQGWYWDLNLGTQDFVCARQALYHLSHASSGTVIST